MQHLKTPLLVAFAIGITGAASAQSETKIAKPWKVELGAFFPTTNESGVDSKTGSTLAFGYSFLRKNSFDLEVELRGLTYDTDITLLGDVEIRLSNLNLNGYFRQEGKPLFYGFGIGIGSGEARTSGVSFADNDNEFIYNAAIGYQFTPAFYGVVRYHGATVDGFRGYSVGIGYRF